MRGATLLETIIVIAIITSLSLMGVNSINNFKRSATIENATGEFISDIRLVRGKSMNGELFPDEDVDNFTKDGLPEYGIKINSDSYELVRRCVYTDGNDCSADGPIEKVALEPGYEISPENTFYFQRITGKTTGISVTIKEKNGGLNGVIDISEDSIITVSKN